VVSVAGDDQRHDLIDELALAHGIARLLVARAHEHGEEVDVLVGFARAAAHESGHELAEGAEL